MIRYVPGKHIDKVLWDRCIENAENGLIYSYSYYLDAMCTHWDALIEGNYEKVMPLPWRKKYGFYYLYQPAFCAQLGIFGNQLSEKEIGAFIKAIPDRFRLAEFSLNEGNQAPFTISVSRKNYLLDLSKPYEIISRQYNENARRNIKKALRSGCHVSTDLKLTEIIHLAQHQAGGKPSSDDFIRFSVLYKLLDERKQVQTYGVFQHNQLLASCVFFFSHKRAYYILAGNDLSGKRLGASHLLIDSFIKEQAGHNLVLDFEGSDLPSIAFFYSSFGAEAETYPALRFNRLPRVIRWLRK